VFAPPAPVAPLGLPPVSVVSLTTAGSSAVGGSGSVAPAPSPSPTHSTSGASTPRAHASGGTGSVGPATGVAVVAAEVAVAAAAAPGPGPSTSPEPSGGALPPSGSAAGGRPSPPTTHPAPDAQEPTWSWAGEASTTAPGTATLVAVDGAWGVAGPGPVGLGVGTGSHVGGSGSVTPSEAEVPLAGVVGAGGDTGIRGGWRRGDCAAPVRARGRMSVCTGGMARAVAAAPIACHDA
jgi:hypothetical protein